MRNSTPLWFMERSLPRLKTLEGIVSKRKDSAHRPLARLAQDEEPDLRRSEAGGGTVRDAKADECPPESCLDAQLAEQARNRDHHSAGPCGQAQKQQKVTQEHRHGRASPSSPLCWAILAPESSVHGRVPDTRNEN